MRIIDRIRALFVGEAPEDMGRTSTLDLSGNPLPDAPEDDGRAGTNRRLDLEQAKMYADDAEYLDSLGLLEAADRSRSRARDLRSRHLGPDVDFEFDPTTMSPEKRAEMRDYVNRRYEEGTA